LSPDSNPIEIDKLPKERDEYALLRAMGQEAANVHLGTTKQVKQILRDLGRRKPSWLHRAGKKIAKAIEKIGVSILEPIFSVSIPLLQPGRLPLLPSLRHGVDRLSYHSAWQALHLRKENHNCAYTGMARTRFEAGAETKNPGCRG